jgi:hypothetical protein
LTTPERRALRGVAHRYSHWYITHKNPMEAVPDVTNSAYTTVRVNNGLAPDANSGAAKFQAAVRKDILANANSWNTKDSSGNSRIVRLNLNQNKQKFFGSFFQKKQKKALLFEKRSKTFLVIGCVPWRRGKTFINRQALTSAILPSTLVR